jgi:hypothetical protein
MLVLVSLNGFSIFYLVGPSSHSELLNKLLLLYSNCQFLMISGQFEQDYISIILSQWYLLIFKPFAATFVFELSKMNNFWTF